VFGDIILTECKYSALLTLETAIPHLNHFCARLPACEFADNRPIYHFEEDSRSHLVRADVVLPNGLDPKVRRASGLEHWLSERQAKKDAAFEAYVALYNEGLVNDNLLPEPRHRYEAETTQDGERLAQGSERPTQDRERPVQDRERRSLILSSAMNPWAHLADLWKNVPDTSLHSTAITIERPSQSPLQMVMLLPESLPIVPSCRLIWSPDQTYTASFHNLPLPHCQVDGNFVDTVREISHVIYHSAHSAKMLANRIDIVTIFVPSLDIPKLGEWKKENIGTEAATKVRQRPCLQARIVRNPSLWRAPQFFEKWLGDDSLQATSLPRKRNFLDSERASSSRRSRLLKNKSSAKVRTFRVEDTEFDRISPQDVEFSLLIPSLLRHIESYYIATQLITSVLPAVHVQDLGLVVEALSAPSADDTANYQRLEHIGDTVLKFLAVTHLFVTHRNWHEGYLSEAKDVIVANNRLAQIAIQSKLDRYILSTPFKPKKWTPAYIESLSESKPLIKRLLSTKVLADVVEALIGAAYVDGGLQRAAECVQAFLPEVNHQKANEILTNSDLLDNSGTYQQDHFTALQRLLDRQFNSLDLLVEAITHPSLTFDPSSSYQRLEFLGDAVLDMVVMQRLSSQVPALSHNRMHHIKSALNNINFQAFLCMEMSLEEEISDVTSATIAAGATIVQRVRKVPLCDFLRYRSDEMAQAHHAYLGRYQKLAAKIRDAIEHGKNYPWSLLTRLEAPKYLSDLVESIFGAVLVDSHGSLAACEKLAEKIGLMSYLNRVLRDDIDLLHPKTRLGELASGIGKVKYHVGKVVNSVEEFRCVIVVGNRNFEETVGGTSREEVIVRASEMAVLELTKSLT
jgi:dsRNA-specific ribonuclease